MKKLILSSALALSLLFSPYTFASEQTLKPKNQIVQTIIKDGMYDDHNAFVDESKYSLEKILESVELIQMDVEYTVTYETPEGKTTETKTAQAFGSGVVIEKKDGKAYILTNNHVTEADLPDKTPEGYKIDKVSERVYITKGKIIPKEISAKKVAADKTLDVAILELEDSNDYFKKFPYKIGNSDDLRPGDFVWIAGNPLGLEDYVLKGNVSKASYPSEKDLFMIGCDVQPGYSGGIVIAIRDGEYELVGLVVATLIRPVKEQEPMPDALGGYGIAIKINPIMKLFNDYMNKK